VSRRGISADRGDQVRVVEAAESDERPRLFGPDL